MIRDLKYECDLIDFIWVEILGTWVSGLLDVGHGLQASSWLPAQPVLWEDPLGALNPAGLRFVGFLSGTLELYILWPLAYISWGLCFPNGNHLLYSAWFPECLLKYTKRQALSCHKQVMVLPSRSWAGVGKTGTAV